MIRDLGRSKTSINKELLSPDVKPIQKLLKEGPKEHPNKKPAPKTKVLIEKDKVQIMKDK